jgi:hypothetical protein
MLVAVFLFRQIMISEKLSLIIIALLFINSIIIWYLKDKAYKKGYNKAENDVLHEMYNSATWLGTLPNKTSYNTLWLFREIYRAKGRVNADMFRRNLYQLDETKRITDLHSHEIERFLF